MSGEYGGWMFWVDVVWKVGTLVGLLYLALRRNQREVVASLTALDKRVSTVESDMTVVKSKAHDGPNHQDMAEIENELTKIQCSLDAAPNRADIDKLHDRISKLGGTVTDVRESISGLKESVVGLKDAVGGARKAIDRLTDHHLKSD